MYRYSIIACARWETPYITEWLAYYESLEFDHVYLYCNDDDPSEFENEVRAATKDRPDFVSLVHFPGQGRQKDMYIAAMERARYETEWVTFLDIDEFLVLRGSNSIHEFMQNYPSHVESVHFNWMYFGNSGYARRPEGSVMRQYTWRSATVNAWNKHLTRASLLLADKLGAPSHPFWHGLDDPTWQGLKRVNVLGKDMAPLLANFPSSEGAYLANPAVSQAIYAKAIINHYALKSEADFELRVARGTAGDFYGQVIWRERFQDGSFRNVLSEMSQVEDNYLRDYSYRVFGDRFPRPLRLEPARPIFPVNAQHHMWQSELQLGSNGRLRHAGNGSLATFTVGEGTLHVIWDNFPPETFIKQGGVYKKP